MARKPSPKPPAASAGGLRTPVRLMLGRRTHVLMAPTFEAFSGIEDSLEVSISQLYVAHAYGKLRLSELAEIATVAANAHTPGAARREDVAGLMFEMGLASDEIRRPIAELLLALVYTPAEAKKKFDADWPAPVASPDAGSS